MTTGSEVRNYGLYINGGFESAAGDGIRDSLSPLDGNVWATVADAATEDVDRAIGSARVCFEDTWRHAPARERAALLRRLANLIRRDAERLAEIEVRDNGKTIREMRGQYTIIPTWFEYYADLADKLDGRFLAGGEDGIHNFTIREPLGVVAGITPWNSPGLQAAFKMAPALAAGNTIVIKPSEHASVATLEIAELAGEAGFPDGSVNVVTGGPEAGAALSRHEEIDLVVFTGSDQIGRKVAAAAGAALAGCVLELGGKSPQLVFEDADLDLAVTGLVAGFCGGSGQTCIAGTRAFVHESVAEEFTRRLIDRISKLRIGDPLDPATHIGPMCFKGHFERVFEYCRIAVDDGAEVLTGGSPVQPEGTTLPQYFPPTVLRGMPESSRAMTEEIFGPVLGLFTFSNEDDAVGRANSTKFGLGAGIWTRDLGRAHRLMGKIDAGVVYVNTYRLTSPRTPLAGFKDSGVGFENGEDALRHFTREKAVWLDYSGKMFDPFAD